MHNIPCSEDYFDINVIIPVFFWLPYDFLSFYFQHIYVFIPKVFFFSWEQYIVRSLKKFYLIISAISLGFISFMFSITIDKG